MIIEIISVSNPEKNGHFSFVNVTYKSDGKAQVKKVVSFKYPEVYKTLSMALAGEKYNVTSQKEGEYWQWTDAVKVDSAGSNASSTDSPSAPTRSGKKDQWVPDQQRQTWIIRQSSVSSAVALYANAKAPPLIEQVLADAAKIEAWVLRTSVIGEVENMRDDKPWEDVPQ